MGFFSWETADTNESIANVHSDRETKTVYLLQPNGKKPITEVAYQGYGVFGGVDVFEWLVETNVPKNALKHFKGDKRGLGLSLNDGEYYQDKAGGYYVDGEEEEFLVNHFLKIKPAKVENYASEKISIDGVTSSLSQHVDEGRIKAMYFSKFIKYPLTFSFSENAVYEDLEESLWCEFQGFFYPE